MNVCIVGTGYVGLVSAACFAEMGNNIFCVDVNPKVVETLESGKVHIYEPGLEDLVKRNTEQGRLKFTTDLDEGLQDAEVVFITVGTPQREDGSCDLKYVDAVAAEIGRKMTTPKMWWTSPPCPWAPPTGCAGSSQANSRSAARPSTLTWSPTPSSSRRATRSTIL